VLLAVAFWATTALEAARARRAETKSMMYEEVSGGRRERGNGSAWERNDLGAELN
jgi:hypothetical protein